jgi:hypothetical protein
MSKVSWHQRQREFREDLQKLRELPNRDAGRQRFLEEMFRRQRYALHEEDLADLPEWVELSRLREQERKKLAPQAKKVLDSVREMAQIETDQEFGDSLWVMSDLEVTKVTFMVWYSKDSDLAISQSNGRQDEIRSVLQDVASKVANAPSEVTFHSHQFVTEKCGGDYFRYLR